MEIPVTEYKDRDTHLYAFVEAGTMFGQPLKHRGFFMGFVAVIGFLVRVLIRLIPCNFTKRPILKTVELHSPTASFIV